MPPLTSQGMYPHELIESVLLANVISKSAYTRDRASLHAVSKLRRQLQKWKDLRLNVHLHFGILSVADGRIMDRRRGLKGHLIASRAIWSCWCNGAVRSVNGQYKLIGGDAGGDDDC